MKYEKGLRAYPATAVPLLWQIIPAENRFCRMVMPEIPGMSYSFRKKRTGATLKP
jgi:hypothetical protein